MDADDVTVYVKRHPTLPARRGREDDDDDDDDDDDGRAKSIAIRHSLYYSKLRSRRTV